ncbi:thiol reductant ABC exporter subunit CydD [Salicibibacter cibarius]|uniref:Thiol reductant ABC exporter subunit CydD n=1 Tax=Salicibibacter cibarius TaxID=2743000 RepID=A0A7T6Z4P1_9BACI|nr:thiol reductant ABC exporter subunit CydD [Salicibibacter cibarius]QQK76677.1 thiol reductant ABC exporter subunit CydD [Salicibibacter cibarius]
MNLLKISLSQQKASMALLVGFAFLLGTSIISQGAIIATVIDGVFLQDQAFATIVPLLLFLLGIIFVRASIIYASGRTGIKMAAQTKHHFRKRLLQKMAHSSLHTSLERQSGGKISILMDAVDAVDNYFSQYIPRLLQTAAVPLMILIVVFTQHVNAGLIMMVTAPFIPLFMVLVGLQTKKKSEEQLTQLEAFSGTFLESLQGLVTLKLFGRSKQQKDRIEESSIGFKHATMAILKVAFTNAFMLEIIMMLGIGLIALEIALQLIIFESLSFFTAFFILLLVPDFYLSLRDLGTAFHNGRASMGAAKKVENELENTEDNIQWGHKEFPDEKFPPPIELSHVSFHYHSEDFALNDVSAKILPYEHAAIVGKSGSGKTTLLNIVAGLIKPVEGAITIDGHSLFEYRESNWHQHISYITQHPYIFSGSIGENIAIGLNGQVSRDEVIHAARQSGISEMIEELNDGYETIVGEGGRGLSGGEKQRLALARAFLKKPSIILFDEPTVGLDLQTEAILQSSIQKLGTNATLVTVAHRLYTIQDADRILLLENGKLMATGTHDTLMSQSSTYAGMINAQLGVE